MTIPKVLLKGQVPSLLRQESRPEPGAFCGSLFPSRDRAGADRLMIGLSSPLVTSDTRQKCAQSSSQQELGRKEG